MIGRTHSSAGDVARGCRAQRLMASFETRASSLPLDYRLQIRELDLDQNNTCIIHAVFLEDSRYGGKDKSAKIRRITVISDKC